MFEINAPQLKRAYQRSLCGKECINYIFRETIPWTSLAHIRIIHWFFFEMNKSIHGLYWTLRILLQNLFVIGFCMLRHLFQVCTHWIFLAFAHFDGQWFHKFFEEGAKMKLPSDIKPPLQPTKITNNGKLFHMLLNKKEVLLNSSV